MTSSDLWSDGSTRAATSQPQAAELGDEVDDADRRNAEEVGLAVDQLLRARGNPGVVTAAGRIFVVGGGGDPPADTSSEAFDPNTNVWQQLDALFRSGAAR
jgi:hypothetical protein